VGLVFQIEPPISSFGHNPCMIIGERVRAIRQQMRLTLLDAEKRTGIPKRLISKLENNRTVPCLKTLERLAKGLRIPVYLFFYTGADLLKAERVKGRNGSSSPRMQAHALDELPRLLNRMGQFDRQLLLSMALEMARRRPTSRVRP
jgi:transcriptional regulator with XRE-family HTH domain